LSLGPLEDIEGALAHFMEDIPPTFERSFHFIGGGWTFEGQCTLAETS